MFIGCVDVKSWVSCAARMELTGWIKSRDFGTWFCSTIHTKPILHFRSCPAWNIRESAFSACRPRLFTCAPLRAHMMPRVNNKKSDFPKCFRDRANSASASAFGNLLLHKGVRCQEVKQLKITIKKSDWELRVCLIVRTNSTVYIEKERRAGWEMKDWLSAWAFDSIQLGIEARHESRLKWQPHTHTQILTTS